MAKDMTLEVLKQIRDEVVGLRVDMVGVRGELTETRTVLTERIDTLTRRQTETEIRLAAELVAVSHAVSSVREAIREKLDDRQRVDDHERRLAVLERKTGYRTIDFMAAAPLHGHSIHGFPPYDATLSEFVAHTIISSPRDPPR